MTLSDGMSISDWSRDGTWIAYRDGGAVLALNVDTGGKCPIGSMSPKDPYSEPLWSWLPDGRVLVVDPELGEARAVTLCSDQPGESVMEPLKGTIRQIVSASPDHHLFVIDTSKGYWFYDPAAARQWLIEPDLPDAWGFAWSPKMTRLAVSGSLTTDDPDSWTPAIDGATGALVGELKWSRWLGDPPRGPDWIDESRFIMAISRVKRGPLMVTPGKDTVGIPTALFGLDCESTDDCLQTFVWSAVAQKGGSYHLVLTDLRDTRLSKAMLYHSENGAVEPLAPWTGGMLSPDGQWLILWDASAMPGTPLVVRPVDPAGAASKPMKIPLALWRPDSSAMLGVNGPDVTLYSVPDKALLGQWHAEGYHLYAPTGDPWSPDGRRLVVTGRKKGLDQDELFVIDLP